MHLKSLKVFCDVVGRQSFSKGAEDNGITQSGASQMVHQLEEHLGVRLLDRSKRPFVLTPEGKVYYQGCRRLVQRFAALDEEVRTLHQEVAGRVSIASIYSVGLTQLNDLVAQFSDKHPKANVAVGCHHPHRVYELVEQDQVDLGMVSYPKSSRSIKGIPWREEPVILICSPSSDLAHAGELAVGQLHEMKIVGFDATLKVRQEFDKALAASDVAVDVVMEFDNIETIKRAIAVYDRPSLLPAPSVQAELDRGDLIHIPVKGLEIRRPIGLIKRRGVELGKTARRFSQLVQQLGDTEERAAQSSSSADGNGTRTASRSNADSQEFAATS